MDVRKLTPSPPRAKESCEARPDSSLTSLVNPKSRFRSYKTYAPILFIGVQHVLAIGG